MATALNDAAASRTPTEVEAALGRVAADQRMAAAEGAAAAALRARRWDNLAYLADFLTDLTSGGGEDDSPPDLLDCVVVVGGGHDAAASVRFDIEDEGEIYPGVSLADAAGEIPSLLGADEAVIRRGAITVAMDDLRLELAAPNGRSFTRAELVRAIAEKNPLGPTLVALEHDKARGLYVARHW